MILERLCGSKTRAKLLNLFLKNAGRAFYVRELTRKIDEEINSVRRELANLQELGLISSSQKKNRRYYTVDKSFALYNELKALIDKVEAPAEDKIVTHIKQIGGLKLVALCGRFVDDAGSPIDLLLVGQIPDKNQLRGLLKRFEQELGNEVNYALMDTAEFGTRRSVKDRFLMSAFNDNSVILYDTLKVKKSQDTKKSLLKSKIKKDIEKSASKEAKPQLHIDSQI